MDEKCGSFEEISWACAKSSCAGNMKTKTKIKQ